MTNSERWAPGGNHGQPRATADQFGLDRALALVGAGAGVRAVATILTTMAAFLTTAVLVRLLGPDLYGAIAFGMSTLGLAGALVLGFGVALSRTVAAGIASKDWDGVRDATRGASTVVVAASVIGGSLVVSSILLTQNQLSYRHAIALGVGLAVLLSGRVAAFTAGALARGSGRAILMELPPLVGVFGQFGMAALLFMLNRTDIDAVAIGYLTVGLVTFGFAWSVGRRISSGVGRDLRLSKVAGKRLLHIAGPLVVAGVAVKAIATMDVFVLGVVRPGREVASYAPTLTLVELLTTVVPLILASMFITAASSLFTTGNAEGFLRLYLTVSRIAILVGLPMFLILAAMPVETLQLAFGQGFDADADVVWVLLFGFFINLSFGLNAQALIASGQRKGMTRAFIWPVAVMTVSSIALVPSLGAIGAAAATTIAVAALNVSMSGLLYRSTGLHPFHRGLVLMVITGPVAILASRVIGHTLDTDLLSGAMASVVVWSLWVILMRLLGAFGFGELLASYPHRGRGGSRSDFEVSRCRRRAE